MVRCVYGVSLCLLLSFCVGCNGLRQGVREEKFPHQLAGTWKGDRQYWEIVIDPNGTVNSIVFPYGVVRIKAGQIMLQPMKMDKMAKYVPGEWKAEYNPRTKSLDVSLMIEDFYIPMGEDTLSGYSQDNFEGPVDMEKGEWIAEWYGYTEFIVNTDTLKDHRLEESIWKGKVTFTKEKEAGDEDKP